MSTSTYGKRSLVYAAPVLWNSLPDYLENALIYINLIMERKKTAIVLLVARSETPNHYHVC